MNVVIDTNVLISGLLFDGKPGVILEAVLDGRIQAYSSGALLLELTRILTQKFGIKKADVQKTRQLLEDMFIIVRPKTIPNLLADKPDNEVLAVTHEAEIEAIITGDKDLLVCIEYNETMILTSDQLLSEYKSKL